MHLTSCARRNPDGGDSDLGADPKGTCLRNGLRQAAPQDQAPRRLSQREADRRRGWRNLRRRGHIRLLLIATLVWAAFWVGGLPSYYQQYSTLFMAFFDLVILVPVTGVVYLVLRGVAIPWIVLPTVALMLDRRSVRENDASPRK